MDFAGVRFLTIFGEFWLNPCVKIPKYTHIYIFFDEKKTRIGSVIYRWIATHIVLTSSQKNVTPNVSVKPIKKR